MVLVIKFKPGPACAHDGPHAVPGRIQEEIMLPAPYKAFLEDLREFVPGSRIYTDPLRTLAYGTDASMYRLTPKIVVDVENEAEVSEAIRLARRHKTPLTFRAAGTSLSGQGVTDSILVRLSPKSWQNWSINEDASQITLQPGIIGARANLLLAEAGKKIGPDPASIDTCKIGGIVSNNSSGMCCGTTDNTYKTIVSARFIFADGTLLDTGNARSRAAFAKSHRKLLDRLADLHKRVMSDEVLVERIKRKFKIKNTTGYSLNALVDFEDPFDILLHLVVGSEGTLVFVGQVTYRTVPELPHKASALLFFPSVHAACEATIALTKYPVNAVEMMDRASLRSVEGQPALPPGLETLGPEVCSLLVETRATSDEELDRNIDIILKALEKHPTVRPSAFTKDPAEAAALWLIRKGIIPSVGAIRPPGTAQLIEDVAFPLEKLADAVLDLQEVFNRHGYEGTAIFGHARDGNLHFTLAQDFSTPAEITRFGAFMDDLCHMITKKYDGSLKAEHGTGRNVSAFVELEWGAQAYAIMKEIKEIFDPERIFNPGVLLDNDPQAHVRHLKLMPPSHELIDKCTECGFCEPTCPSRALSLTPRQRISSWRAIQHLQNEGAKGNLIKQWEKSYGYLGDATCATDGLCALRCPASINTGSFIKHLRAKHAGAVAKRAAAFVGNHFAGVCKTASRTLDMVNALHNAVGTTFMQNGSCLLRAITFGNSPAWNRAMPKGGGPLPKVQPAPGNPRKVVYFPSCISRSMGPGKEHDDARTEPQVMVALLHKAGYDVIIPAGVEKLCCGMAFASKGLTDEARVKETALSAALLEATNNGEYPVISENGACLLHMKETLDSRLTLHEPIGFIMDVLREHLTFTVMPRTVAVHATCSVRKMNLTAKLTGLASLCASQVVAPLDTDCCGFAGDRGFSHPELNSAALHSLRFQVTECEAGYSTSRTCQIGLSLHSGIPYYSILHLVDAATNAKR